MSGPRLPARSGRRLGAALLLAAIFVPALFVGIGETMTVRGPEEAVLVAPDAKRDVPSDRDGIGAPLVLLLPAGLLGGTIELPEPLVGRLLVGPADRLPGGAPLPFSPPPPRRA